MNVWYNFAPMNEAQKYILQDLSVAIADDHVLILEGFKSLMEGCGVHNVETFSRAADLIRILPSRHFDVYIIDIGMPDIDGFELVDSIRCAHADARIIVNTIHEEIWLLRRMLDKDVNAIMLKSTDFMQMIEAITAVVSGEQYLCPGLKKNLSGSKRRMEHPSEREIEILKALAGGHTSKEIASMLFISENTVETHRKRLFAKLGARNMADLIVRAVARGYINASEIVADGETVK